MSNQSSYFYQRSENALEFRLTSEDFPQTLMSGQAVEHRLQVEFPDDLITPLLQVHHWSGSSFASFSEIKHTVIPLKLEHVSTHTQIVAKVENRLEDERLCSGLRDCASLVVPLQHGSSIFFHSRRTFTVACTDFRSHTI